MTKKLNDLLKKLDALYKEANLPCKKCPDTNLFGRGCCYGCMSSNGFFELDHIRRSQNRTKQLNNLKEKYKFDLRLGFFEEGKGCKLPRAERSTLCNKYFCLECSVPNEYEIRTVCKEITIEKEKLDMIY